MAAVRYLIPALVGGMLWAGSLGAQATATIAGTVVDSTSRQPLTGVTVIVEGTQRGSVTGSDGVFRITGVPTGTVSVRARRIGYISQARTIVLGTSGTASVTFELPASASVLEGVVVTGYGSQRRVAVTGSIATIDADAANVGVITNVDQMIEGRAAGVNMVQNSGEPGGGAQIRIRGGTSISASNDPLYVIDGVPVNNISTESAGLGVSGEPPEAAGPGPPRRPAPSPQPAELAEPGGHCIRHHSEGCCGSNLWNPRG